MKSFNFEKNLDHQSQAVNSTISAFSNLKFEEVKSVNKNYINPVFDFENNYMYFCLNIDKIQKNNQIDGISKRERIIDIMMETGTGKTYTYTKTIFELNKHYKIFKFIIIVPSLSIKAGTVDFLRSDSSREHFKEIYGKTINLHIVESQKNSKNKKSFIPPAISSFVNAGNYEKNAIQVMIINSGMLNSDTLQKSFDRGLFDEYTIPIDAIKAVKPFVIIDEPHRFTQSSKTWKNIKKMKGQFIFRYGATFPETTETIKNFRGEKEKVIVKDYNNLVYQLTAVDSFNRNLVKGVIAHITEFEEGKNAIIKLKSSDIAEATFELDENNSKKTFKIGKKDSLGKIHNELSDLFVENCNKTTVLLSNGLELKKDNSINPYSYAQTIQESMLQKAIHNHFILEKELLTRTTKIKPLTLFFIDNIEEYRREDGYLKVTTERLIINEINNLLKIESDVFYKNYLLESLKDISLTHGGYFSKDNSDKDEAIEKQINEILHDKQAILDLENPRRFIFSKWTLREGWDNPNVFQICKLRSSGSEISKLQEVGRGLRLPVNEFGNRVKDEQFFLNYFVDFTESDFVDSLINEINTKSGAFSVDVIPDKLTDALIKQICDAYNLTEGQLLEQLDENNVVTRTNNFKDGGFEYIKLHFPSIFVGVNTNKIKRVEDTKKKITIRKSKYPELKALWEKLNEKVILEYKFDNEDIFKELFVEYLNKAKSFKVSGIQNRTETLTIKNNQAYLKEETTIYSTEKITIITMTYSDFLKELAKRINININTLHSAFKATQSKLDINDYLNQTTINIIKQEFEYYLLVNAIDKFSIEYKNISNVIHPTKLTNKKGEVLDELMASDIGIIPSEENVAENYLFNELYFDSELEKENITNTISEVIVFTKIPKNSIKIPVAGGKTYSPDFAYVIEFENGTKKLNFIVETKNVNNEDILRNEEISKIRHAEKYFGNTFEIKFKTQFSNDKIFNMINEIIKNE